MASDEMTDEKLVDEFGYAARSGAAGAEEVLRAELLRRLSAGNPQAEKVQITRELTVLAPLDGTPIRMAGPKPERSDGRISDMRIGDYLDKLASGSDGRIQGGGAMPVVALIYELTRAIDAEYAAGDEIEVTIGGGHLHMRVGPVQGGRHYGALLVDVDDGSCAECQREQAQRSAGPD